MVTIKQLEQHVITYVEAQLSNGLQPEPLYCMMIIIVKIIEDTFNQSVMALLRTGEAGYKGHILHMIAGAILNVRSCQGFEGLIESLRKHHKRLDYFEHDLSVLRSADLLVQVGMPVTFVQATDNKDGKESFDLMSKLKNGKDFPCEVKSKQRENSSFKSYKNTLFNASNQMPYGKKKLVIITIPPESVSDPEFKKILYPLRPDILESKFIDETILMWDERIDENKSIWTRKIRALLKPDQDKEWLSGMMGFDYTNQIPTNPNYIKIEQIVLDAVKSLPVLSSFQEFFKIKT